ncbi:MAG TPA: PLP-dependent transferase [Acidimicrobiia bacterium]|jgi:cystathionine gamma-synthase|nr:PLP-dependent transferase [Acidimicrobiia bacterium]
MNLDPFTAALHADADLADVPDVAPPVRVTTTYDRGEQSALEYRRSHHPTTDRFEAVIGALEGGHAVAFPSGMAAALAILRHVRPARIAIPEDVYHGVRSLVRSEEQHGAIEVVDVEDLGEGDLWWIETPSNPKCLVTDIAAAAAAAATRGVIVAVDSTFATPVLQRPLALGAHLVMHSTTKFIAGHSDAMGGVVVVHTSPEADALRHQRMQDGAIPGSLDVWLALRGVRTLPLRVERQSSTASEIAAWLNGQVLRVWHPSLPDHPGFDIARRQMSRSGGVLSFELESGDRARAVVDALRLFRKATSLGGVESLAEWRRSVNPAAPEGLIRLSMGLEAPADLMADLEQAVTG